MDLLSKFLKKKKMKTKKTEKIKNGDTFVVAREIDGRLNYNIALYTGEHEFSKLCYQEYLDDEEQAAQVKHFKAFLVNKYNYTRDRIAVIEIINSQNSEELIRYLEESKSTDKNYVDYVGTIDPGCDFDVLNDMFMSDASNALASDIIVTSLDKLFEGVCNNLGYEITEETIKA